MKHRSKIVFSRIAAIFLVTLLGILGITLLTINQCYVGFLKKQRIEYNEQLLSKVYYDMHNIYIHGEYLINILDTEEKYSMGKLDGPGEKMTVFKKIKEEIDFEEDVTDAVYANALGEYAKAVIIFDNNGKALCTGKGMLDEKFPYKKILGQMKNKKKQELSTVRITMDGSVYSGLIRNDTENPQHAMVLMDLDKIAGIMRKTLFDSRSYFITDHTGEWIYQSNMEDFMSESDSNFANIREMEMKYDLIISHIYLDLFEGELYVVDRPEVIFRDIDKVWQTVWIIIGFGSIAGTILFLTYSRKVLFPISKIKNMIHEVENDYDTYLTVDSEDEFGEIAEMINYMKIKIKNLSEEQMMLEIKTTEARLQALQSQINPHFLYNTLDNIYCIAQVEEIQPITILARNLSDMLRYSINTEQMFVTLQEEINYIKAYLKIINVRYDDAVTLKIQIPEQMLTSCVFRLSLQPLVENACLHGILPGKEQKGSVCMKAYRQGGDMIIQVINSGILLDDGELEKLNRRIQEGDPDTDRKSKGAGIALTNVNERIRLFYGKQYGLRIYRIDGYGTCAEIYQKFVEDGMAFIDQRRKEDEFSDSVNKTGIRPV